MKFFLRGIQSIVTSMGPGKKYLGFFLVLMLVILVDFLSLDELQLLSWRGALDFIVTSFLWYLGQSTDEHLR